MSYSRWSTSRWYTFWSAMGAESNEYRLPTKKLKRSQVFEICDMPSYFITYGELVDRSRSSILHEVKEHFSKEFEWSGIEINKETGKLENSETQIIKPKPPTWEELRELQDYFGRFIIDVDEYFKPWNFFKYEWLYPIRNKMIFKYRKLKLKYVKDRSK